MTVSGTEDNNPIFHGDGRYAGEVHDRTHEPIITKKLFDEVQMVLGQCWWYSPLEVETALKTFIRLLHCTFCGYAITSEIRRGHTYYRCTRKHKAHACSQPSVREEALNQESTALLKPFSLSADWVEHRLKRVKEEKKSAAQSAKQLAGQKQAEIDKFNARLQRPPHGRSSILARSSARSFHPVFPRLPP